MKFTLEGDQNQQQDDQIHLQTKPRDSHVHIEVAAELDEN